MGDFRKILRTLALKASALIILPIALFALSSAHAEKGDSGELGSTKPLEISAQSVEVLDAYEENSNQPIVLKHMSGSTFTLTNEPVKIRLQPPGKIGNGWLEIKSKSNQNKVSLVLPRSTFRGTTAYDFFLPANDKTGGFSIEGTYSEMIESTGPVEVKNSTCLYSPVTLNSKGSLLNLQSTVQACIKAPRNGKKSEIVLLEQGKQMCEGQVIRKVQKIRTTAVLELQFLKDPNAIKTRGVAHSNNATSPGTQVASTTVSAVDPEVVEEVKLFDFKFMQEPNIGFPVASLKGQSEPIVTEEVLLDINDCR